MLDKYMFLILKRVREKNVACFKDLRCEVPNPKTLSNKLKSLVSMNLLTRDSKGYRLTERGLKVTSLLEQVERELSREFKLKNLDRIPHSQYSSLLKRYCEILIKHFGDRLVSVLLFGSVARGDWKKDSDIDLIVVAEGWEGKPAWERIAELLELKMKLRESVEFKRAVEAGYTPIIQHYPLSPDEALRFHRVYLDALLDGIILYDKNGFLEKVLKLLREKLVKLGSKRIVLPDGRYYWVLREAKVGEKFSL